MAFSQRTRWQIPTWGVGRLRLLVPQATMNMAFGQGASIDPCKVPMADGSQTAQKPDKVLLASTPMF